MRCVVVTNIPVPYRLPVLRRLPASTFLTIFCAASEQNRNWSLEHFDFPHIFLKERARAKRDGFNFVHNNPDVWGHLEAVRPDVVITTGFNPTHLYAFAWSVLRGARHVAMTDGTLISEARLSRSHRLLRRLVFSRSASFIVTGKGGRELLNHYSVPTSKVFVSPLCADNAAFAPFAASVREYDVAFCGQIHERKLPFFFADVCRDILKRRGQCRALVLGDGPLRTELLDRLAAFGISVTSPGFIQPAELASWYSKARVLLFPTRLDPWGVVANEAMACGTPVITTPEAGVAGDLVVDGKNGRVLSADVQKWADASVELLNSHALWHQYSTAALSFVQDFSYDRAASQIVEACMFAAGPQNANLTRT